MTKFQVFKFKFRFITALIMLTLLVGGCGVKDNAKTNDLKTGELPYTKIDPVNIGKLPSELQKWYEEKYKTPDLHSYAYNGEQYLLISAGEKRTAGYEIKDLMLIGTDQEIEVKATLKAPGKDEIVATVLTYPHVLVKIKDDGRKLAFNGISGNNLNDGSSRNDSSSGESEKVQRELKTDSGRYTGQIDNNSIEVAISGVPDKKNARAFQLGIELKEKFADLGLKTNDDVKFKYYVDQYGRSVMTEIEKLGR